MIAGFISFILALLLALGATGVFIYGAILIIVTPYKRVLEHKRNHKAFKLTRSSANPILSPTHHEFENQAVFNSAAVHDGETTHLFYRALGSDGVSRIGYATSKDGSTIDERLPYPVFSLENADPHLNALRRLYAEIMHPELVASGGSWGGTEDPRAVLMDGRVYLTFSAFQSWDSVRMAVASIDLKDLQEKRWKWSKPTFLSPKNQVHKNWVMFPEKIKGAFAFLHSISPQVEIAYRSSIGSTEPLIESPTGARVLGRKGRWDTRMRGAGAAPIKTDKG